MYTCTYTKKESEREKERQRWCTAAYVIKVKKAFRIYVHLTHWVERNYS